jgi:hypothetical protein
MYVTVLMTYDTICHEYNINLDMFWKQMLGGGERERETVNLVGSHAYVRCSVCFVLPTSIILHCSQLVFECGVVLGNPESCRQCDCSMAKLCLSKVIVKIALLLISFGGFSAFVAQMMVVCVITSCYMSLFRNFGGCVALIFRVTEFGSESHFAFLILSFELHE